MRGDRESATDAALTEDGPWATETWRAYIETLRGLDDDGRMAFVIAEARAQSAAESEAARAAGVEMTGCQARVWVRLEQREGRAWFTGASEALIVQGLVRIMARSFSALAPDALLAAPLDAVRAFPLGAMTTHRQVGMMAMLRHMQRLIRTRGGTEP